MSALEQWIGAWLEKAGHDLRAAQALMIVTDPPYDVICFHAQQSVEKHFKAFLTAHQREVTKTHDLIRLLTDCADLDASFAQWREACVELTPYAVAVRYPDSFYDPTIEEAQTAVDYAVEIRDFIREKLSRDRI